MFLLPLIIQPFFNRFKNCSFTIFTLYFDRSFTVLFLISGNHRTHRRTETVQSAVLREKRKSSIYHGKEGTEWEHPNLYYSHACISIIPMYQAQEGIEWEDPNLYHSPCQHPHLPSHPNVPGRKEQSGNIPTCSFPQFHTFSLHYNIL